MADTEPKEKPAETALPNHSWGCTLTPEEHAVLEAREMQRRKEHEEFLNRLDD